MKNARVLLCVFVFFSAFALAEEKGEETQCYFGNGITVTEKDGEEILDSFRKEKPNSLIVRIEVRKSIGFKSEAYCIIYRDTTPVKDAPSKRSRTMLAIR